jgi:ATP-dependent helicase/nuclease subunit A
VTDPTTDPIAADERSRTFAQSEFGRPVVVVAGAGTGKTALLVARVVAWCVGPGWERHADEQLDTPSVARKVIERVVAITFTEAAAAEMARKIGLAFLQLARGERPVGWDPETGLLPPDTLEVENRARALSEEGHRLVVSTIHAFCQRLLSTYPLEAGLHPRFEVDADGSRIDALAEEVVEDALRSLGSDDESRSWELLAAEGVGPREIAGALVELVEAGATSELFSEDPFNDSAVVAARLRSAVGAFRTAIGDRLEGRLGEVIELTRDVPLELAEVTSERSTDPSFEELTAAAVSIDPRVVERLKDWSRRKFGKRVTDGLGDANEGVAAAAGRLVAVLGPLMAPCRAELEAARSVMAPLLESLQRRRSAAGLVTFTDQLRCAERLISEKEGVRREVVAHIDHLLVDEFQDTDDVQCRLVESLAFTGDRKQRPSLFIVGDPKQSIYAWRSADLAAYDSFVERVVQAGGETVDLVRNFRSVTPILDEVERLVAPVMREQKGIQPRFQKLEATDQRRGVPGVELPPWKTVEHWLAWPRGKKGVGPEAGNSTRQTSALEAGALARDIRSLRDEGVIERWGDVAVLLRVTTAQEELLEALREAGVPYEVAREREYYRQREVVEAAALVRCVLEPTDALSLLTVIRSDVVGVPDVALAPLWDAGFAGCMARVSEPGSPEADAVAACIGAAQATTPAGVLGADALPRWPKAVQGAVDVIVELRQSLQHDPPDIFVEKIRTLWLAEVTASGRYLGNFRRARIDAFLTDLETTLVSGSGSNAQLARFLRQAVEAGQESRVPVPPDLETDAVHVMTIHKAKGLDFEHVYVAQVHKGSRGGVDRKIAGLRTIDGHQEYQLFGWTTPGYSTAEWVQAQKTRAEMVRLLYVAATRAKNRLVISGGWGPAGEEEAPEAASNFAKLIGRRLDPGSIAQQISAENEREDDEYEHVLRVIPVFSKTVEEREPDGVGSASWSPPAVRLQRAAALAGARRAAEERMAQPVFRSASTEAHQRLQRAEAEDDRPPPGQAAPDRQAAMALGSAVHGMLETLDLDRGLSAQVLEREAGIRSALEAGGLVSETESTVEELLRRIAAGTSLARLESLAGNVLSRELSVFGLEEKEGAPGAVVSGIVDLVYRDPDDGRLVVADFKTDPVSNDDETENRAQIYQPQVRTYARILRDALNLEEEPHVELWFLSADRIVRL